jgi:hypothetical protein
MANILSASVAIEGTRPLLWHAFTPDAIPIAKRERTGTAGNDPAEWRRTVLATREGQLYIKHTYVFGCLRDGAKFTTYRRGTLQPMLASTLLVLDRIIPIEGRVLPEAPPTDEEQAVFLDIQSVRNPTTRARNVRYRIGAAPGWRANFRISWDKTVLSREQMQAIAHDAGRLAGIGDGRTIGYGRFVVTTFELLNAD